jgi:hypothetical protein
LTIADLARRAIDSASRTQAKRAHDKTRQEALARLASTMPGQGWDSRGQSFEASQKLVHVLGSERSERAPSLPRRRPLREPDPSRRSAAADRVPTGVCASSRPACAAQTTAARTETSLPAASLPSVPPNSFSDHQPDRLA